MTTPETRRIVAVVRERPGITTAELAEALGISPQTVRQWVRRLEAEKLLYHRVYRGRRSWRIFVTLHGGLRSP